MSHRCTQINAEKTNSFFLSYPSSSVFICGSFFSSLFLFLASLASWRFNWFEILRIVLDRLVWTASMSQHLYPTLVLVIYRSSLLSFFLPTLQNRWRQCRRRWHCESLPTA